jgi:transposase
LGLDWHTVKALEMQYMQAQLKRAGTPAPRAIGIDEISIRKGHTYRIVVSDLDRGRPIWFGGEDRSETSMGQFYGWLGARKSSRIGLAVMDMWKPFRLATAAHARQAAILFDKFHIMRHLGEALDEVRKSEYRRLADRERRYIKGQKYTLLSRWENLTLDGKTARPTARHSRRGRSSACRPIGPYLNCVLRGQGNCDGKSGSMFYAPTSANVTVVRKRIPDGIRDRASGDGC